MDGAALLSACLLAFNPAHIRLSATENLFIPIMFFALFSLAALLIALKSERRPQQALFLLSGASLTLAMQTHPLGVLLVIPLLL
jgi:4-amino-4-deoxy-L-arabinose transferase-like glycosyltransferase